MEPSRTLTVAWFVVLAAACSTDRGCSNGAPHPRESVAAPSNPVPVSSRIAPTAAGAPSSLSVEDAGACLERVDRVAQLLPVYTAYLHGALGFEPAVERVTLIVTPSFTPPWKLSMRRAAGGADALRLTKLDQNVWGSMLRRMEELHGPSANPAEGQQREALASLKITATRSDRSIDPETARELVELFGALTNEQRTVDSTHVAGANPVRFDGTRYRFWHHAQSASIVSPQDGSLLHRATSTFERLARWVEANCPADDAELTSIREHLRALLADVQRRSACAHASRE